VIKSLLEGGSEVGEKKVVRQINSGPMIIDYLIHVFIAKMFIPLHILVLYYTHNIHNQMTRYILYDLME